MVGLGHSVWDVVSCFGWPEKPDGQMSWVPSVMTVGQGLGNLTLREQPAELCLLLARTWTLEVKSCTLGPCPFLSRQRIIFVW